MIVVYCVIVRSKELSLQCCVCDLMEIWLKKNGDCIGVVVLLKKCMKVAEINEVQGSWNF